jgi:4-hydroxy-4-methyl-2-oxoglutarate aldolase
MNDPRRTHPRLGTAQFADALVGLGRPVEIFPALRPVIAGCIVSGPALPVRHIGSIDVFLEAIESAKGGEVLAVSNEGRLDEGCLGDLVALEAQRAGIAGIVIDGAHRDTLDLRAIGLPVWSRGACPFGPRNVRSEGGAVSTVAMVGHHPIDAADLIVADDDGVVIVSREDFVLVRTKAERILRVEGEQKHRLMDGRPLREQLEFAEYKARRRTDPAYTFRRHLTRIGGAGET